MGASALWLGWGTTWDPGTQISGREGQTQGFRCRDRRRFVDFRDSVAVAARLCWYLFHSFRRQYSRHV